MTIHRMTNHPSMWSMTEIHIQKVKNLMTGGKISQLDSPLRFDFNFGTYTIGGINPLKDIQL